MHHACSLVRRLPLQNHHVAMGSLVNKPHDQPPFRTHGRDWLNNQSINATPSHRPRNLWLMAQFCSLPMHSNHCSTTALSYNLFGGESCDLLTRLPAHFWLPMFVFFLLWGEPGYEVIMLDSTCTIDQRGKFVEGNT